VSSHLSNPAAFVVLELSAFQLGFSILIVFAAIALSFLLGLDEGKVRGRQEIRKQSAEDRADPLWLSGGRH
jgi:hypothetical protein